MPWVLDEYRCFYNEARPHQGIEQRRPAAFSMAARSMNREQGATVVSRAVECTDHVLIWGEAHLQRCFVRCSCADERIGQDRQRMMVSVLSV